MIRAIALVDLDDTLFQTRRKCPPDVAEAALTPLGFARDGSPLSYATPRQRALIDWLGETALMIPVTARSLDALRRVRLAYGAAICAHGGVVLTRTGAIDAGWQARIATLAEADAETLMVLAAAILARDPGLAVRVLAEDGMPLYVLAKHPGADDAALHAATDAVPVPPGWTRHVNGNNVALMPPWLGKAAAVEYLLPALRAQHPALPVIGIGDSLTDAPFMRLCDWAMTPTGSQLATALP